jgi:endogenous inhibitor of DNA gyrase (YacG/DUF329 family)
MDRKLKTDLPTAKRCPVCKKPIDSAQAAGAFCSARCQTIDLGRWLDESYKVSRPIEQSDIDEEV